MTSEAREPLPRNQEQLVGPAVAGSSIEAVDGSIPPDAGPAGSGAGVEGGSVGSGVGVEGGSVGSDAGVEGGHAGSGAGPAGSDTGAAVAHGATEAADAGEAASGPGGGSGPEQVHVGMGPQTAVLLVSGFATVLLFAVATLLPVPYAVLKPGPAINTLGMQGGKPMITVTGHATYPAEGTLDLTTVTVVGGPGGKLTIADVILGVLDPSIAVVPEQDVFPTGQTQQQNRQQNQQEMATSQEQATAAALTELGITVPTTMTISQVSPQVPAATVLHPGDVLLAVNGVKTPDLTAVRTQLQKVTAGGAVTLALRRDGTQRTVTTRTSRSEDGRTVLGILIDPTFHFPFTVKIQIDDIGGPSAGMMFALGIIDVLTPGSMTGGRRIAGTGTIDSDGTVGKIGGIQEKMIGARDAGARWFLAPKDDCDEVAGRVPGGLHVIKVSTLHEARRAVAAIAAGTGDGLPTCSG